MPLEQREYPESRMHYRTNEYVSDRPGDSPGLAQLRERDEIR